MITQKELKHWLSYSPIVGVFEWRRRGHRVRPGMLAGCCDLATGYVVIRLRGKTYRAHHLAWLYMTGEWPPMDVDHKDGDRNNNAFANLRLATKAENQWNKKASTGSSGVKGVNWDKALGKWRGTVGVGGKKVHVGVFSQLEEAQAAVIAKRKELHGEFANNGLHGYELEELANEPL